MRCKSTCGTIAYWLIMIGALNMGLVGLGYFFDGNWNVINLLLGQWIAFEYTVYLLIGISAVVSLFGCKKCSCEPQM